MALAYGPNAPQSGRQPELSLFAAGIAIWILLLLVGAISGVHYTVMLIVRHRSAANYSKGGGRYWLLVSLMAMLWLAGVLLYGNGAAKLGVLGPVLGWPVFYVWCRYC